MSSADRSSSRLPYHYRNTLIRLGPAAPLPTSAGTAPGDLDAPAPADAPAIVFRNHATGRNGADGCRRLA